MTDLQTPPAISVLGLGAMGAAVATAATRVGFSVAAWNRTRRTAAEIEARGLHDVTMLDTAAAAVQSSDLVVLCVRDHAAAREVLDSIADDLRGQVVVNISTGTPTETVETAKIAESLGVRYVTGAVMVPTPMVATDECLVIYAGSEADLADIDPLGDAMGGTSDVTGPDHAVPPALDLAMLDIYFTGMYAHLHATALAAAQGVDPQDFLPYAQGVVGTLGASLAGLTSALANRRYDSGEARLDMCTSFLQHIVTTSRESGLAPGLAEHVHKASLRALTQNPGSIDWDVVAEDFLPTPRP